MTGSMRPGDLITRKRYRATPTGSITLTYKVVRVYKDRTLLAENFDTGKERHITHPQYYARIQREGHHA